jgi:hypothetical protein
MAGGKYSVMENGSPRFIYRDDVWSMALGPGARPAKLGSRDPTNAEAGLRNPIGVTLQGAERRSAVGRPVLRQHHLDP